MSQTSATAAGLVIAWIIFITVRGELPRYFGALGIGPAPERSAPAGAATPAGAITAGLSSSYAGSDPQANPIPTWAYIPPPWGPSSGGGPGGYVWPEVLSN